nr:J domain-containing protein [Desulfovermiculus halophilus]
MPYPSDVSSANFWRSRAKTNSGSAGGSNTKNDSQHTSKTENTAQAYAVLGLRQGATMEEIRKTYYRLAQIHHPDRFASLGEEAVAAATNTFKRINEAYEFLVKHA